MKETIAHEIDWPLKDLILYCKGRELQDGSCANINPRFDFLVCSRKSVPKTPSSSSASVRSGFEQLIAMGFPEQNVVAALQASNDDPDAAVAFLLGEGEVLPVAPAAGISDVGSKSACINRSAGSVGAVEIEQLKTLTQQHPALLQSHIEQLVSQQSHQCQRIVQDPIAFIESMMETGTGDNDNDDRRPTGINTSKDDDHHQAAINRVS